MRPTVVGVLLLAACSTPSVPELRRRIDRAAHIVDRRERADAWLDLLRAAQRADDRESSERAAFALRTMISEPAGALDPAIADAVERVQLDRNAEVGEMICGAFVARVLRDPSLRARYLADKRPIAGCLSLEAPDQLDAGW